MSVSHPSVGFLVSRISRLGQRWLDLQLKKFGITSVAMPVLAILQDEGFCTQRDLASRIGIEQPTMAQLLKRMERDGLIVRTANPDDARSARVSLTEQASHALPGAREVMQRGYELVTVDFTKSELATLTRLLERYLASVESQLR